MKIHFHKLFLKRYQKLDAKHQLRVKQTIQIFTSNPHLQELNNHSLRGKLIGKRAIKVNGDIRIIFVENDNYKQVVFLDVGTHAQVY